MTAKTTWTTCPRCRKSAHQEVVAKQGGMTQFQCADCGHNWQVSLGRPFQVGNQQSAQGVEVLD